MITRWPSMSRSRLSCSPPRPSFDSRRFNLGYTEIRSPIDGKIGQTAVTEGNVVSPASGTLTAVVSQDPIYVTFPVPVRTALQVRDKLAHDDGFGALRVRIRLPNGRMYGEVGKLDFLNNSVSGNAR